MRICLLTNQDLDADPFDPDDWPADPRPFVPEAEWTLLTLKKESAVAQVVEAHREGHDLFFNLCDGAWDSGGVGIEVVQTLEWLNVPYTGATPEYFEPSREAMKRVCRAWDIPTPAYVIARTEADVERAAAMLRFPLFVKHPSSYASSGLTRDSRAETDAALRERAREMVDRYGAALIEEFIEGIEYTVLVGENPDDPANPITYQPIQYRFPDGESFKHYTLKWVNYDGLEGFPVEDPGLDRKLREVSARFFTGMRGASFGRCDIRVDGTGTPFMLEINPNCGIYYPPSDPASADICLHHDPGGHEGFTRRLIAAAFARHRGRQKGWRVLAMSGGGYGVFATRDTARGERIVRFEEQAHHLVTRRHVEGEWNETRRGWFDRYAWPLTDEVWVTWSPDPEEWRPINHACDPTAWLEGLDVAARRDIQAGEEITLDYGTFYDERMPDFQCECGSRLCRGTIRGDDWKLPSMKVYGRHMSDHILGKRGLRS